MNSVKAKKSLGQHFLKDPNIARKITDSLLPVTREVLEIGPGMGVLTRQLFGREDVSLLAIEVDRESVDYLQAAFPAHRQQIIHGDFLKIDTRQFFPGSYSIIGNLPYNISSQIFFRLLEERDRVPQMVCMIQKEVAERIAAPPGNKTYGILSVLLQAFYDIEYLFTVNEQVFDPPPKVKSAVIRLVRNGRERLSCDEKLFFRVVKMGFNQRRKTLRNALKAFLLEGFDNEMMGLRPEQLSVDDFVALCQDIQRQQK